MFKGFTVFALFLLVLASGACLATSTLIRYQTAEDFAKLTLSHARWDQQAGGIVFDASVPGITVGAIPRGVVESPVVESPEVPVPA